jgi:Zn-dependent protease with chaperone function
MQDRQESPLGWLALYGVTVALELPVILARYAAIYLMAAITLRATGHPGTDAAGWAKLAVLPTLWSAAALVYPAGSGWWWQQQLGGREPSKRERLAYRAAMDDLEANTANLLLEPKRWFVMDESEADAAVCGDTLMLTKGLLEGPHLTAALAHQLGHLQGIDARLTAALNRLVINSRERPRANIGSATAPASPSTAPSQAPPSGPERAAHRHWAMRMAIALLRGGLALRVTSIGWGQVWRKQEYEADRFAARIGQGEELAELLEAQGPKHDHPIPLVWLTDHTHPPTELRIDALRALAGKQPPLSAQTAPMGSASSTLRLKTEQ